MDRTKVRRRSATRIIGIALVALAYMAVLVWASDLTAADAAAATAQVGAQAAQAAQAVQGAAAEVAQSATVSAGDEQPFVTVAIAVGLAGAAGLAWAASRVRRRRPLARSARLVVRHITTLM